jgi:alkanesulfonate monooxygenase SsuD/methylene tetrahydromethanopterin reductase-like flavin-dependent oxidoreductase (luciferase family)
VLVVRSERAVAIMLEAWPTAPEPELSGEHFHVATPDLDFAHVESVSKPGLFLNYSDSLAIARRIADELRRA